MKKWDIFKKIIDLKLSNIEEIFFILSDIFPLFINNNTKYGKRNIYNKKILEVIKLFFEIIKEEDNYFNLILISKKKLNINDLNLFLEDLDKVNEDTMFYFINYLDNINYASLFDEEYRLKENSKSFDFIIETNIYRKELVRILLGDMILKKYLNYEEPFYELLKDKTVIIEDKEFYGLYIKLDNDKVSDLKLYIPYINNLETLLINIHEYDHAYRVYLQIGKCYEDIDYETLAKQKETDFLENIFMNEYKRIFKK